MLKEEVLIFTNKIAEIVHQEVFASYGGANKNIGDAFLVMWKLSGPDESDINLLTNWTLTQQQKDQIYNQYRRFENPTHE